MDTRKNKKRSHQKCYIREKAHIKLINTFLMKKRLSWFGHVQRRDEDNVAKSALNTRIDGSCPRGRPKLRWMDRLNDDMKKNNIRSEWASDRESWFNMMKNNICPEWASDRENWFNMMKNNIRSEWTSDRESLFNMMKNNIHPEWASDRERAGST